MNVYPFFIECSKFYSDPHKKKLLQELAFGRGGGFIIKRKEKNILVTSNGEFIIPSTYSDEARLDLDKKLWKRGEFEQMQNDIKNARSVWSTTKKKDKLHLLYKYIAELDLPLDRKSELCSLITLVLLLKIIKPSDIVYKDFVIESISDHLLKNDTIQNIDFTFDYSTPLKTKKTSNMESIDEEDEY
jgi:hypothetical protein